MCDEGVNQPIGGDPSHDGGYVTPSFLAPSGAPKKSIGYNIYPQAGGDGTKLDAQKNHPHIILDIVRIHASGNTDLDNNGYLNITALNQAGGYVTEFEAGHISKS